MEKKNPAFTVLILLSLILGGQSHADSKGLMTTKDLPSLGLHPADHVIHYGDDPLQFVELRLPRGKGPHPVIILIHGGCWLKDYNVDYIGKLARAFTEHGIATWTPEYRRVGNDGGNWPGLFQDILKSSDHMLNVAGQYGLDINNVIASGHSAGGQLALWLAARDQYRDNPLFYSDKVIKIRGVLGLAPAPDLETLYEKKVCGHVIDKLMQGSPLVQAKRYAIGSPMNLVPIGINQKLIVGRHDEVWTPGGRRYYKKARKAGDTVTLIEAGESGHFEMIDPDSTSWPLVLKAASELLEIN